MSKKHILSMPEEADFLAFLDTEYGNKENVRDKVFDYLTDSKEDLKNQAKIVDSEIESIEQKIESLKEDLESAESMKKSLEPFSKNVDQAFHIYFFDTGFENGVFQLDWKNDKPVISDILPVISE